MTPKKPQSLKFKQVVNAPLGFVYEAFTSATGFTEWLCDIAQAKPYEGGRLYFCWHSGYYAAGEYIELQPDKRLVFTWGGRNEPGITTVDIKLKQDGDKCLIQLTHKGLGRGKYWKSARKQIKKGWQRGLENLKSVLETGEDGRLVRRPLLGVVGLESLDEVRASELGIPQHDGVRITGIIEGMNADRAGFEAGDVIFMLDGQKVSSVDSLVAVINEKRAGDRMKVGYLRGDDKRSLKITLMKRPLPDIPQTADALSQAVGRMYAKVDANLDACLVDVRDADALVSTEPGGMSVKQILAHLIAVERDLHAWIASLITDREAGFTFFAKQPTRLHAIITAFPELQDLVTELHQNQVETVAMIAGLPEQFVMRKRSYWRLAYNMLNTPYHYHEYCNQIRKIVSQTGTTDESVDVQDSEAGEL